MVDVRHRVMRHRQVRGKARCRLYRVQQFPHMHAPNLPEPQAAQHLQVVIRQHRVHPRYAPVLYGLRHLLHIRRSTLFQPEHTRLLHPRRQTKPFRHTRILDVDRLRGRRHFPCLQPDSVNIFGFDYTFSLAFWEVKQTIQELPISPN